MAGVVSGVMVGRMTGILTNEQLCVCKLRKVDVWAGALDAWFARWISSPYLYQSNVLFGHDIAIKMG